MPKKCKLRDGVSNQLLFTAGVPPRHGLRKKERKSSESELEQLEEDDDDDIEPSGLASPARPGTARG